MKKKSSMKINVDQLNKRSEFSQSYSPNRPGQNPTSFGHTDVLEQGAITLKKPAKKSRNGTGLNSRNLSEDDSQSSAEQITNEQKQREVDNNRRRLEYILNVEAKQTFKNQQQRKQINAAKKQVPNSEESDDSTNQDPDREKKARKDSQTALDWIESQPGLHLNAKGIWSREVEVDYAKLQKRLSTFGLYGLDHDLKLPANMPDEKKKPTSPQESRENSRSPSETSDKPDQPEPEAFKSDVARRVAANEARRLDMKKIDLQNCISSKFKVEKIDIAFKVKITENAARMFEKVIKEFATAQKAHDDKVAQQQQKDLTKREQKQQEIETGQKVQTEKVPGDIEAGQEAQPPDKNIDKTVVKAGKAEIEKGKELNSLEHAFLQEHNFLKEVLQLENLRHETVAGAILLKEVKNGDKTALEAFSQLIMSTTTNKQKMRGLVFKDEYGGKDIADIEGNFAESKFRKQAKQEIRKERRATMRKLYSNKYDAKFQKMIAEIDSGEIKVDKFGNPLKNQPPKQLMQVDKYGNTVTKKTEPPTEYSSHSSDQHESDEESSEVSSFDSEASRINFWRDINTADDTYTNAVIVSNNKANMVEKKGDNFLKEMQDRQSAEGGQQNGFGGGMTSPSNFASPVMPMAVPQPDVRPPKPQNMNKQVKQDLKKQQFEIKNYQKDIKALQVKIEKMKQSHDLEKKNIKQIALTYAIDYFKQKTQQLVKLFTNESLKMLQQYSYLRDQLFQRDEILKRCARYTIMQEEAIMELRQFIERNFNDCVNAMMSTNAGSNPFKAPYQNGHGGDGKPSFDRMLSTDPDHLFDLYTSIIHDNKASDQYAIIVELKNQIESLRDQINALNEELKLYNQAQEIWLNDKAGMEYQLKQETAMVAKLQDELAATLELKNKRIKMLEELVTCNKTNFEKDKARLNAFHKQEELVHNLILDKYENEYENMKKQFRQVKNVLRIPRLNSEYQALMKEIKDDKQLEVYLKSDLIRKNKEIEPEGFESISACLKMQFTKELDIKNLKYEVLKNIDIKTYDLEFGLENPKYNKNNFQFNSQQWTDQATKRTKDSIYAAQTESNQVSKQQDLSYLIHSYNSRKHYNRSNDPNNKSLERDFMDLRKKNITQNPSNTRASYIPQNTDIFIQNSEEMIQNENTRNFMIGTSRGNTQRRLNEEFMQKQFQLPVADQSILSSGSLDHQQDQDISHFMNINDIQGGFSSQNAIKNSKMITLEDYNMLTSGASIESKQVNLKFNPKYEHLNFKRNVKTQNGPRNNTYRETQYFSQNMNLNMVPNINNFRSSMPAKKIENKNDLVQKKIKPTVQTYHDLFAMEDGITSPDLVHINSKLDSFSPLSVRGIKQPVSPSPINVAARQAQKGSNHWQYGQKFINVSTPPDQHRDTQEDQVFNSTTDIIKSSNRINLRNSQQNNIKQIAHNISPNPDSRQFKGLRLQSMNEDKKNVSTDKTSNIVSQNLSGFKPISSQNMTIEVQSLGTDQRKSTNKRIFKKPTVQKLQQKQTGFLSQRQLVWNNVNKFDKK